MNIVKGIGYAVAHPIETVTRFFNWIVDMVSGGERRTHLVGNGDGGATIGSREVATSSKEGRDIEDPDIFATAEELVSSREEDGVLRLRIHADPSNLRNGINECVLNPTNGEKSKLFWKAYNAVWKILLEKESLTSGKFEHSNTHNFEKGSGDLGALRQGMRSMLSSEKALPSMAGLNDRQLMDVGMTALAMLKGAKYENFYQLFDEYGPPRSPEIIHANRVFKEVLDLKPGMKQALMLNAQPIRGELEALLDAESKQLHNQVAFALNTFFGTDYPYRNMSTTSEAKGDRIKGDSIPGFTLDLDDDNDK